MELSDPNPVLVADAGTCTMKAGNTFASTQSVRGSEDAPKVLFPNVVGYPRFKAPISGLRAREFYVGDQAIQRRGHLRLKVPGSPRYRSSADGATVVHSARWNGGRSLTGSVWRRCADLRCDVVTL